jgi:hypothetical protein
LEERLRQFYQAISRNRLSIPLTIGDARVMGKEMDDEM